MNEVSESIEKLGVVPVVAIDDPGDADHLADALIEAGLPCAEITLRTNAGIAAMKRLASRSDFLVGAGTVHSPEQAAQAVDAGAKFVVAPGFNPRTVQWCLDHDVVVLPGVSGPTDLEFALEYDLKTVKLFPAEAIGGVKMLKALHGPYASMRFMPTGGISLTNLGDYLQLPYVVACGGSWMVRSEWIADGRFDEITRLTQETMTRVDAIRSPVVA